MIIQLESTITTDQKDQLAQQLEKIRYQTNEVNTQFGHYLIGIGKAEFDIRSIGNLPGIKDIHRVSDAYKLVSKKWKVEDTVIDLGDGVRIGTGHFAVMAGPCSIESEEQIASTIEHLQANGIKIMRGGVYKPRSSPYSFRGLGIDGLKMWYEQTREAGIKIITEVMMTEQIDAMIDYVDIFQVGARNAQNFNLLDALGKVDKPVLLKRGISGTVEELLQAAEYIFSNGNERIMLCERGIRSYESAYRNTMDLNAVAILKEKSHLPVIADPSHGIGVRRFVDKIALASVMAGADGVIVEVHQRPEKAFSDGQQTLSYKEAERLYSRLRQTYGLRESF
ncbi:3-deoxy-7-phosphoheptulonate synthase [Flavilitoribacter nigricans]|uniref:3-deoxy-7-phosphoheptulonate synthase n=1 Tax=Flavilitoribacter nigricans (strain ATCC 23147 / DSM 23189 / NBRC 102662 / NCIMB 1420 / SS-2) TaxID=1122177 RepID=A0A2D0NJ25_FLAN2|nr:3-deoxy-7-phosphoheptulonate synthase [Flavilitoribacter nigricans]PHN08505.1 3-deoxy-7-phosphoheptulonate synthase [Flavilitoribacter nigricans DSM 23189 = NBRC 102662]